MIRNALELYAHAIAMEREAAQRYGELAERMQRLGHVAVAEVFDRLSQWEAEHLEALLARTREIEIPEIMPGEYRWLDAGAPERASAPLELPLLTPRQALGIALSAECRAQVFFETAFLCADDSAVRALAREMAMEEAGHIALIEALLQATAAPLDARPE